MSAVAPLSLCKPRSLHSVFVGVGKLRCLPVCACKASSHHSVFVGVCKAALSCVHSAYSLSLFVAPLWLSRMLSALCCCWCAVATASFGPQCVLILALGSCSLSSLLVALEAGRRRFFAALALSLRFLHLLFAEHLLLFCFCYSRESLATNA